MVKEGIAMIKTYFGVAHPWLCDVMGHMNTRYYAAMFDDASAQYLGAIGWSSNDAVERGIGWAHVHGEIQYKQEVLAGAHVAIESGTVSIGTKSLTMYSEMRDVKTGALHGTIRSVMAHFDLKARQAIKIPEA